MTKDEKEQRIGQRDHTGKLTWPALTANGRSYERPASTLDIGHGAFVVLDLFIPLDDSIVDGLREYAAPEAARPAPVKAEVKPDAPITRS